MSSKTLVRARVARWPLIAAAVAALSVVSAVALLATVAWTSVGGRTSSGEYLDLVTAELVTVVVTEFDSQSRPGGK